MAALGGLPGQVAYAASKAGQLGMVRTLAAENASRGITVNAVLPGMVATEQVLAMPAPVRERALAAAPSGRLVEPAEIAAAVAFLAGEESAQVSGQTIAVDGGASLNLMSLGGSRRRGSRREMPESPGDSREARLRSRRGAVAGDACSGASPPGGN